MKIEYEVINNLTNKRWPGCVFNKFSDAMRRRREIIKKRPELEEELYVYKTWKKDGVWWGDA